MQPPESSLWAACRASLRANLVPGLVIQAVALAVIAAWWWVPSAQPWFVLVGNAKEQGGLWFPAVSTALAGGLVPWLVLLGMRRIPSGQALRHLLFYLIFFAWKGVEVDLLYRLQGSWFGNDATLGTLTAKVVVDQFVYNPLWAGWTGALFFRWRDGGLTRAAWKAAWTGLFRRTTPAVLVSTWLVWIPAVSIIYALPASLQIPLFNLVLCFFVLVITVLTTSEQPGSSDSACPADGPSQA